MTSPVLTTAAVILLFFGAGSSVVSGAEALLPLGTPHFCAATTLQVLGKKPKPKPSLACREISQQGRGREKKKGIFSCWPRVRDLIWSVLRKLRN